MDFRNKTLRNCNFSGMDFAHTLFCGADLSYSDFSYTNLLGADLSDCVLHGVNFYEANLCGTNFTGAEFLDPELRRQWEQTQAKSVEPQDWESLCICDDCDCPIWDRPVSRYMGDYLRGDWIDDEVLETLVLPLIERKWRNETDENGWPYCTDEPDWDSIELNEVSRNISWARWAHNDTAFFHRALHDILTIWPTEVESLDFPYWNQPDGLCWSEFGMFFQDQLPESYRTTGQD
jgi:hypothetical protein